MMIQQRRFDQMFEWVVNWKITRPNRCDMNLDFRAKNESQLEVFYNFSLLTIKMFKSGARRVNG